MNDSQIKSVDAAPKELVAATVTITDRDINMLRSAGSWLHTRAQMMVFTHYKELMMHYSTCLEQLANRLEPIAVAKPVTMDEIFGNTKS